VTGNVTAGFTAFRALHAGERVLVLANAWDAASAALIAAAGARAIATSSAGLSWSCGYADGDALPRAALLSAARSICAVVTGIPVTVDIEGGYSGDPSDVAELVAQLFELGVAGVNIEDGSGAPDLLAAKIEAVKRRVRDEGGDIFINARTDVFLRDLVSADDAERETIARAGRYAHAGADGIFVPELSEREAIRRIAGAIARPLNLMAVPGLPPASELYALGVRRLSAGAALAKFTYGAALEAATAFMRDGDCDVLFSGRSVDYGETNALLRSGSAVG
jgi:2-methylisocitrate lyase-like PEP mutase family enzyme